MTFELDFEGEMDLHTWKWPKALQGREQNEQSPTGRDVGGVRVEQWTNRSFGTEVCETMNATLGNVDSVVWATRQKHLESLLKQITQPHPQSLDSVGLCWGPRTCSPNKSPRDADAAGPRKTQ